MVRFGRQRLLQMWSDRVLYPHWVRRHSLSQAAIENSKVQIEQWQLQPKFSILLPVYNVEAKWLKKAIESVRKQIYPGWELCIADDASSNPEIKPLLIHYQQLDPRIKVVFRSENGHISAASNSALALATGEFLALLDHDDELTIDALFENAKLINQYPNADFIYSDEDKINGVGDRREPVFKPDWSPEYFHSTMYTCHLGVFRTELVRSISGFRLGYEGSQDYDLVLRVMEQTDRIHHIPKVLYHWRSIAASAASGSEAKPWAYQAGYRALEAMLARSAYPGQVEETQLPGMYRVRREITGQPLVSVVLVGEERSRQENRDRLRASSTYQPLEFQAVEFLEDTIDPLPQRISRAVDAATGEFVLLLNPDLVPKTPDWIEAMLEFAQQRAIGAVGAKILLPDHRIRGGGLVWLQAGPQTAFHHVDNHYPGYCGSNVLNRNYLAVSGDCLMLRRAVFLELGGLDAALPSYWDVDLCLKAHQAGYRNVATPFAQGQLSHDRPRNPIELKLLQQKWQSYLKAGDPYYNPNLSQRRATFEFGRC
ncbi:MAG TPA: glycosyltransferase [Thermosynechococcaceae cyanobacterium]